MLDHDEFIRRRTSGSYNGRGGGPLYTLPERDVRRRRSPVIMFLLRVETLQRVIRVISLLALDLVGVVAALVSAMALKLALLGTFTVHDTWGDVHHWIAFAYLVTVLMFARVDLYADRPRRPGLARIASALFQATVIALVFALANGKHFSSYYIFYGSLFFGVAYLAGLRSVYTRVTGHLLERAGYRRRAVVVGSGDHIDAVAHALAGPPRTHIDLVGFVSLVPRPENGLRSLGEFSELADILTRERVDEVVIADPDFPQEQIGRAHV